VISADGEAKFWLEPELELAKQVGYSPKKLREIENLIKDHQDEVISAWREHFGG
jgi:hypothetical protein